MRRTLSYSMLLLAVATVAVQAGADGYLRQGPPPPLRLARAPIPPPPVNELILALGRPVEPAVALPTNEPAILPSGGGLPAHLQAAIQDLISKPAPAATVVDTAASPPPEAAAPELPLPGLNPPVAPPADMANHLGELLLLFNHSRRDSGRRNSAVVVAPPAFLPPQAGQPAPSSRAVYRSQ